jgi:uncharacterized protein YqiB (DUF1249 family)
MCVKSNNVRTVFLLMKFSTSTTRPNVIGIVKQYPLYKQIYEDTKYTHLNEVQLERMGFKPVPNSVVRMFKLDIPIEKLY